MGSSESLLKECLRAEALRRGLIGQRTNTCQQLEDETFPQQRAFIVDESRRSTVCTPRRAAKTEAIIRKLLRMMKRKPGSLSVYVSMTRENAKRNIWSRLQVMNSRYSLGLRFNHADLIAKDPQTGSELWITGLATGKELAKLRGNRYDIVVVDEAQDILIDLEDFVLSVIVPALGDRRGQLVMAGTPDPWRRQQFWYHAATSQAPAWRRWVRFSWLLTDNTYFQDPVGYLKEILEVEGYTEDDPRFQAEYLGLWTNSKSNLVIDGYEPSRNNFLGGTAALAGYEYLLGLDPGFKDATAFVVAAYSTRKRHIVFPESFARPNMIISAIAEEIRGLMGHYPISNVVCDEDGMGRTVALELVQRFGLPITAAEKKDKRMRMAFLNSDLRTARLQVIPEKNLPLISQWNNVMWDAKHQREQEGQVCDLFDASGYAHMACRSFWEEEEIAPVEEGDRYWSQQLERARHEGEDIP